MIELRPFASLGAFRNDWLNAKHHFSFGSYRDPARSGVGGLVVWNDDEIAPGTGFSAHPHRDMEIITYVREGAITHRDSLGNHGRTEAGDVQVMHAGRGITHEEVNAEAVPTRLFQIWLQPNKRGAEPGWGARVFPKQAGESLTLIASGEPADDALPMHADARVFAGKLAAGITLRQPIAPGRHAYLVASAGSLTVNGVPVGPRDGVVISGEDTLTLITTQPAEVVVVETV
jgi:redox-sensitive bicupin YhaK (pirin superfamily)